MVATVTNIGSASSTVHYFEQDGYYAKGDLEHRKASFWHGGAAKALGLGRHMSPKRFNAILSGFVPATGLWLGSLRDGGHQHRPGGGPHAVGAEVGVAGGAVHVAAQGGTGHARTAVDMAAARPALPVHEAVWRAVEHLGELLSVFAAGDIAAHALGQAPGRYSVEEAEAAIGSLCRDGHLVEAVLRERPFFGSLALRLPIRADASRETLASDGHEICYAPEWVAKTDAHAIEAAIARAVLDCALKHHTRRGERDPERWQRASQMVTHGLLRDAGFTLPPDAEAWDGMSVEQACDRLPEPDANQPGGDDDPSSGGGDAGGGADNDDSFGNDNDADSNDSADGADSGDD